MMKNNELPPGWDRDRVQRVLHHYENQTEDDAVEEDETLWEKPEQTIMEIPTQLVPTVRKLIAKHSKT